MYHFPIYGVWFNSRITETLLMYKKSLEPCLCTRINGTLLIYKNHWNLDYIQCTRIIGTLLMYKNHWHFAYVQESLEPCLCTRIIWTLHIYKTQLKYNRVIDIVIRSRKPDSLESRSGSNECEARVWSIRNESESRFLELLTISMTLLLYTF